MGFEVLIIIGVIAAIAIGFTKNRNQQINQSWNRVAQELDLSLRHAALGTKPQLSGFVEGHDLTVDIDKKRRGKSNTPWTRFRLGMSPLGLGLKLRSEGFFGGISKAFGAQDIQVGDATFDDKIRVQGSSEAMMREYLTPERRRTIQHFLSSFKGAVITDDEISLSSRGYVRDSDQLLETINAMLQVARSLTEMRDDAEPDTGSEEILNQETGNAETDTPADSAAATARTTLSAPPGSPAVAEFCDAVFAPGTLSFDATKTFKEKFDGKRVVWSGTLESASPFTFDINLGSKGGVKAVLSIHTDTSGPTGTRAVKAVIGLPAGTEGLGDKIGQRVSFAGTLHKIEGFARKVVLTDAELAQ